MSAVGVCPGCGFVDVLYERGLCWVCVQQKEQPEKAPANAGA